MPRFWNPVRALRARLRARRGAHKNSAPESVIEHTIEKQLKSAVDATLSGFGIPALMREHEQELRGALLQELNRMLGKERHLTRESAEHIREDIKGLLVKRFGFEEDAANTIVERLSREIVKSSTR